MKFTDYMKHLMSPKEEGVEKLPLPNNAVFPAEEVDPFLEAIKEAVKAGLIDGLIHDSTDPDNPYQYVDGRTVIRKKGTHFLYVAEFEQDRDFIIARLLLDDGTLGSYETSESLHRPKFWEKYEPVNKL